jgi:hemolysin III
VETHHNLGDILANAITHGIGALLAIAGAAYLITASVHASARESANGSGQGSLALVASVSVFSFTLVLVYVCSTLYHSLVRTRARHVFQVLDHSAIYLLIAGTYTPFTLVSLHGVVGWWIFGVEWGLAVAGVLFKSFAVGRFAVFATRLLANAIGWHGVLWLAAGGVAYTLGVIFFALDRLRYFHATWHVFVLAGSFAHYCAVLLYVVPARP